MTYQIPGAARPLPAQSPRELVYFQLSNSRTYLQFSDRVYMRHFAIAFHDLSGGLLLNTETAENFVSDLVRHGWLQQQA
ncbi:hypothetical protein [Spirosoma panaciterrae]|uniref:hypothetical protein n=1 Tax=Spirosoma panaciterrae TaxID=496058 RepID=UPI00037CD20E|nr:hypothetical protein [Spirosoma panaciterrae]